MHYEEFTIVICIVFCKKGEDVAVEQNKGLSFIVLVNTFVRKER